MLKLICPRRGGVQPRLVNLTFDTVCVTYLAGMAAIELPMYRGSTPQRPDAFGEGDLAGREPGNRLKQG